MIDERCRCAGTLHNSECPMLSIGDRTPELKAQIMTLSEWQALKARLAADPLGGTTGDIGRALCGPSTSEELPR